eukprot:65261_1
MDTSPDEDEGSPWEWDGRTENDGPAEAVVTAHYKNTKHWNMRNNTHHELLIHGYIRQVQTSLKDNKVIPDSVSLLIQRFWSLSLYFSFQKWNPDGSTSFGVLNSNNLEENGALNIHLTPNKKRPHRMANSFCFVPQITSYLSKQFVTKEMSQIPNHNALHAIFGTFHGHDDSCLPVFFLFDTLCDEHNNTQIVAELQSKKPLRSTPMHGMFGVNNTLFTDTNHGILYEHQGIIYQLKLQDMKSTKQMIFNPLNSEEIKYCNAWNRVTFLNMCYLEDKDKLFGVKCVFEELDRGLYSGKEKVEVACGVFDLMDNQWKYVKPYQYNKGCGHARMQCVPCYDSMHDSVFMITGARDTVQYEFVKDKWLTLCDKDVCPGIYDKLLWVDPMDANILNTITGARHGYAEFKYFDIRTDESWQQKDSIEILKDQKLLLFR